MRNRSKGRSNREDCEFAVAAVLVALVLFAGSVAAARLRAQATSPQPAGAPQWQVAAGGKRAFDIGSVKQDKSGLPPNGPAPYSNVALGPGDYYSPTGGLFSATNLPLFTYITFAYKATANQVQVLRAQVPKWVLSDRFDIQARVDGSPTKDQMRLMMQSLLADRFALVMRRESRQLPVFALVPLKEGKTGPQLQAHPADASCSTDPELPNAAAAAPTQSTTVGPGFPVTCGGVQPMSPSAPGRMRIGGRNVTMELIASTLAAMPDGPDRPVLDRSGLSGTYDFFLEWTPQFDGPEPGPGAPYQPDPTGLTFLEALKEQLGLKLESQKGPVDVLVMDHVEEPSEN